MSNLEILKSFFEYTSRGEFEKLGDIYSEDFILEIPFASLEGKRIEGMAEVAEFMVEAMGRFQIKLNLTVIYETTDPDVLIAEYTSEGKFLPEGVDYDNRYISVYKFKNGKICEVKEFFNPLKADINLRKN